MNGFLNVSLFLYQFIINVCQTFFFDRPRASGPRLVLATTCLLPASTGIIITVHRYLLVLIVCYSCRSLRDGMSVRIIPSHDILSCQYSIMSNFSFNGLRIRISADRSCNRMFTVGISRNHDNCTSLPPSLKLNCAARRLLFSWENVREADQLES